MNRLLLIIFLLISSPIVFSQSTSFSFITTNDCLPSEVQFTAASTGNPIGYLWDFGNGTRSNKADPVAIYTAAGSYSVRLITVYENSTAQARRTVVVNPSISATFTADREYLCSPGTVNFSISGSGNIGSYEWNFGDGSPVVVSSAGAISHNYSDFGEYYITLTATSTTGCSLSESKTVKIIKPVISGSVTSPLLGCVPATTSFTSSVTIPPGSSVSNYLWNFADGTTLNGTVAQVSHTYTQTGGFSPTLSIVTMEGCTATYTFDSVAFGIPPVNHNAFPLDTVYCGSDPALFIATATNANRYDWNFGGGARVSVTDTSTEHKYTTLGAKNVSVVPFYNGCAGTTIGFRINIIGVIAKYRYANTCQDKKTFLFDNTSQGNISTISWSSDNQLFSNNRDTVSRTFPAFGVFPVRMLISDSITGCVDSSKTKIYTADPELQNPDRSICINTTTQFQIANNYLNPSLVYYWDILGVTNGPVADSSPVITATTLGNFTNGVILNNGSQYCPDTLNLDHIISVTGPELDFTAPTSLCINTPLSVVNLSHPYQPADTIRSWAWNFGRVGSDDSSFQPQPYSYTVPKSYNVKLSAVDIHGCSDSLIKKIFVRPEPFLWIIPKRDTICEGQSSTLTGYTSDQISWTSANLNFCTTCDTTIVRPVRTTKYYATATNSFNCVATDSAMVTVFSPFTADVLTPDTALCAGATVMLDVEPKDKIVNWSPAGSLSNANSFTPMASPLQTTNYVATLNDSVGCFSSTAEVEIKINSKPLIDAGPNKIYPYNSNFSFAPVYSNNIQSWLWTPSDSLSCSSCPTPMGIAATTKTYFVKVVSDSGCVATDQVTIFIECNGANLLLPSAFTANNDGLNDLYYPVTRGIKTVTRFAIFNRGGQLMYEMRDFVPNKENSGWDGRFRGQPQSPGAYVYLIEAVCDLGQKLFYKGSFILIR